MGRGGNTCTSVETDSADKFFDLCCESRDLYPLFAAELLEETGVDIELERTGTLDLAFADEDAVKLKTRYEWQRSQAMSVEHLTAEQVLELEPNISPNVREALLFPNDWQVENRKLVTALRHYAELNGIQTIENTLVTRIIIENGKGSGVETNNGTFAADTVVIATGAWTSLIELGETNAPVKIEPVRGQILAFRPRVPMLKHVVYSSSGYLVPRVDGRILAGSTTEHVGFDTTTTSEAAERLKQIAIEIAPGLAEYEPDDHWSGLRPFAADGLPVIGDLPGIDGVFVATGHYRNGILLAPLTARIAADRLVNGISTRNAYVFGPSRFTEPDIAHAP